MHVYFSSEGAKTPSLIGTEYSLSIVNLVYSISDGIVVVEKPAEVTIENVNGSITYEVEAKGGDEYAPFTFDFSDKSYKICNGENKITYKVSCSCVTTLIATVKKSYTISFTIYGVSNRYPLKPWTNEEVIERVLQLAEPLRLSENPRFTLDKMNGDVPLIQFDELAPEFTFTQMNMREIMQTIGGVLHGEPRLHLNADYTGWWTYDAYGGNTLATYTNFATNEKKPLNGWQYTTNRQNQEIEQACTKLDSYQDNLVNRINWQDGTVSKPSSGAAHGVTLRTESLYVRLAEEDTGAYYQTEFPIDKIKRFAVVFREYDYAGRATRIFKDITEYVFPLSVYENLSSYSGYYPSSKSYALYYEQGQKDIKGFFFKPPSNFGGTVGKNYSIVNILKAADVPKSVYENYDTIEFFIEYVPIYSTRVQHSKVYLSDYLAAERTINYSQSDNSVETRYFGENIKGAAQRLGTVERYVSFNFYHAENIPKAGDLWDEDYYISTVNVAVFRDRFEITCGLSKHFNRKSKYIGANSHKRIYEVSETMVQERHTVVSDYIVIEPTDSGLTYKEWANSNYGRLYISWDGFDGYCKAFKGDFSKKADEFRFKGYDKNKNEVSCEISLPCIASAFGNVIEFTAECADNFSAGTKVTKQEGGDISGYFTQGVEYGDYYGRIYYLEWGIGFSTTYINLDKETYTEAALSYPEVLSATKESNTIASTNYELTSEELIRNHQLYRKDSREKLKFSYRIETVAGDKSFVIGTGLSLYNPLVANVIRKDKDGTIIKPKIYVLGGKIGKFDTLYRENDIVDSYDVKGDNSLHHLSMTGVKSTVSGQAWVIAYPFYYGESVKVENEDGEEEDYTPTYGGEILVGRNVPIKAGDMVGNFVAYAVNDLQKYINERRQDGKLEI